MEDEVLRHAESLFNIPYWQMHIINFKEKKKELIKILESYPEESFRMQTFFTNRQRDRSGLAEQFTLIMNQELKGFSDEIQEEFEIHEIWSVSYDKGDYQTAHNHGSVGLTGILYLDLSKDSPETQYIQPWNDYLKADSVHHYGPSISEGDIVVVPSFVLHHSEPNKSENKKRIVSWDMKIL